MRAKNVFLIFGLMAMTVILAAPGHVLAGAGPEPPAGATITGPEIWGVLVISCDSGNEVATVRVKRVVNCETFTEAKIWPAWPWGCPNVAADLVDKGFDPASGETFFGLTGTPFITKVKNFERAGNLVSCDVQFKFFY